MLYPDLDRPPGARPPSLLAEEARASIAALPERWRPGYDAREPADVLAVIGAMALTAAAREPAGWDGAALRCAICPVELLAQISVAGPDQHTLMLVRGEDTLLAVTHQTGRIWAGMVTARKIWASNQAPVSALYAAADDPDDALAAWCAEARPETDDPERPSPIRWDAQAGFSLSCTGYDDAMVGRAEKDGFAVNAHDDIIRVGARPIVELYALIGASVLEANGRWPRRTGISIPRLHGVVLRDWLDLQRWMMIGDVLPVIVETPARRASLRSPP